MIGTEIKELYNALQRFIERKQKMHIPLEQDDDDVVIANAFDELEKLREENKRLREALEKIIELNQSTMAFPTASPIYSIAKRALEGGGEE